MYTRHDASVPVFIYLAWNNVHSPCEAPDNYLAPNMEINNTARRSLAGGSLVANVVACVLCNSDKCLFCGCIGASMQNLVELHGDCTPCFVPTTQVGHFVYRFGMVTMGAMILYKVDEKKELHKIRRYGFD